MSVSGGFDRLVNRRNPELIMNNTEARGIHRSRCRRRGSDFNKKACNSHPASGREIQAVIKLWKIDSMSLGSLFQADPGAFPGRCQSGLQDAHALNGIIGSEALRL